MSHFHITLPSDSSLSYHPQNTVAHYITKLSGRIRLDGDYEVGLAEIIYPHSWFNINNRDKKYWFGVLHASAPNDVYLKIFLKNGYYTGGEHLATDLTQLATRAFGDYDIGVKFNYNVTTGKFTIFVKESESFSLVLSDDLKLLLGYKSTWTPAEKTRMGATEVFDLNRGLNLMYVYCDIATHTIVGDTSAPLLRVCSVDGNNGEIVRTIYTHPHYVPVAKREFDTIEININTEHGQPMPFEIGKSVVTLHFRRRHSILSAS